MENTLEVLFEQHQKFAEKKFKDSTPRSSLQGLRREIKEVLAEIKKLEEFPDGDDGLEALELEYVDCVMYLIDSMGRAGISVEDFKRSFEYKLQINLDRKWKKNKDGSYSHIK